MLHLNVVGAIYKFPPHLNSTHMRQYMKNNIKRLLIIAGLIALCGIAESKITGSCNICEIFRIIIKVGTAILCTIVVTAPDNVVHNIGKAVLVVGTFYIWIFLNTLDPGNLGVKIGDAMLIFVGMGTIIDKISHI